MSVARGGTPTLLDYAPTPADFRAELLAGLRRRPRLLPCKFFYDQRGSELFDRICDLPEYYPTRTELGILRERQSELGAVCGPRCRVVELGSGNGTKIRLLLDALADPAGYVPIDISRTHLLQASAHLADAYPELEILPVCADYAQSIKIPATHTAAERTVVFFPGSTIGNFGPADAASFLRHVATWCARGDGMVIGVDLAKPESVLLPAYNDSRGVTAAFNLNLLVRANAETGANFNLAHFRHRAVFNARESRVEMHLVSARRQHVTVAGERFDFEAGETIVTEYSYKYRPGHFAALATGSGWQVRQTWTDPRGWFGVFVLELMEESRPANVDVSTFRLRPPRPNPANSAAESPGR